MHDARLISTVENTKTPAWAQQGGLSGTCNGFTIEYPDGRIEKRNKVTGLPVPEGTVVKIHCGGGGGYGSPSERAPEAVQRDLAEGYISEQHARQYYPHAFA